MMWFGWTGLLAALAAPEVQAALEAARKGGEELGQWFASVGQYAGEIKAKGFPQAYAAFSWPPFDVVGDTLRGTRPLYPATDLFLRDSAVHAHLAHTAGGPSSRDRHTRSALAPM